MKRFISLLIVAVMLVTAIPLGLVVSADEIDVTVKSGFGGSVYYNRNWVSSGTTETLAFASPNEKVRITANQGYVLNRVYLDGKELSVTGNNFQVNGLKDGSELFVTFKKPDVTGIGVDEITWDSENIVVEVKAGESVKREVFERISILPENGKFVEFKSENGSYFVPCGGEISGYSDSAVMGMSLAESGQEYDWVKSAIEGAESESEFKAYRLSTGIGLPEGSEISINLGADFKDIEGRIYVFSELSDKVSEKIEMKTDSNGQSERIPFSNTLFLGVAFDKAVEEASESENEDKTTEDLQQLVIIILCAVLILLILIVIIILVARKASKKKRAKKRAKLEKEAEALELAEKKKAEELARVNAMAKALEDKARADAEKRMAERRAEEERIKAEKLAAEQEALANKEISPEEKMKNLVSEAEEKERLAREAEEEASRSVKDALAREAAARQAVEDAAREAEAARVAAAEEAARIAAEKAAAEEAARIAAEKAAAEEAARIAAEKAAAEGASAEKRDCKFCFHCGTKLKTEDVFCHNCGTKQ